MCLNCGTLIRYKYQITPNSSNSCGGADMWADIQSTEEIFCPAGYYCPSTTKKDNCSSGYWSIFSILHFLKRLSFTRSAVVWFGHCCLLLCFFCSHYCRLGSTAEESKRREHDFDHTIIQTFFQWADLGLICRVHNKGQLWCKQREWKHQDSWSLHSGKSCCMIL